MMIPLVTMWKNSQLCCVISGEPDNGGYFVTVTEHMRNRMVLERAVASVDEALAVAKAWTPHPPALSLTA